MSRPQPARRLGDGALQRLLLSWYRKEGRADLPWRSNRDPYRTVVSESMLAQTQVDRVVPKFDAFVKRFPGFAALAQASPGAVLRQWKGLGYNRRAVNLQRLAKAVVERFDGVVPSARDALISLPGVGPYTVAAIRAFAFNLDDAPVDTNVRRIVRRIFFAPEQAAPDARAIENRARELVPSGRAHDWNSALMDLGAAICTARAPRCSVCPVRSQCAAARAEPEKLCRLNSAAGRRAPDRVPFRESSRFARGRIIDRLRDLPVGKRISLLDLHADLVAIIPQRSLEEVAGFVGSLEREGLVMRDGNGVALQE